MNNSYFVSGIGTSVGKTMVSSVLVSYWEAEYWKPIQSGDLDQTDSMMIDYLLSEQVKIHPERYKLKLAASPHYAAEEEGIQIKLEDFKIPETNNNLIIEGAGGLMVPISESKFIIDLIEHLKLPVILVCNDYLGCINHTLLSYILLKERNIKLSYLVLNGEFIKSTERILLQQKPRDTRVIRIPWMKEQNPKAHQEALKKMKIEY